MKRKLFAVYIGAVEVDSESATTEICQGKVKLIFTSPESLLAVATVPVWLLLFWTMVRFMTIIR